MRSFAAMGLGCGDFYGSFILAGHLANQERKRDAVRLRDNPLRRAIRCRGNQRYGSTSPFKRISPPLADGSRARVLNRVVLPTPFGPKTKQLAAPRVQGDMVEHCPCAISAAQIAQFKIEFGL